MNLTFPRIQAAESFRFGLIVALLFFNSVILESNEVIATSGFISNIGVQRVVWVWAADMLVVMLTAALYSIVVDHTDRVKLTTVTFASFGCIYLALYGLFQFESLAWITYPLLTIVNDQQWSLFSLMIWALANDTFSTAQAKRLFPLLAMAVMLGGVVGNSTIAVLSRVMQAPGSILLLINALLMLTLFLTLLSANSTGRFLTSVRPSNQEDRLRDVFVEGLGFIRDVPTFRYLAFAMIPLGFGLNTVEFHFLSTISVADEATVQTIYGAFKAALSLSIVLVQGLCATWLINQIGLRRIFMLLPIAQLAGLVSIFGLPIYGAFLGNYLTRVTLIAIDEPARRMLFGLTPDERRGRVSAFMNGYLYPLGAILGCIVIGLLHYLTQIDFLDAKVGQHIYLGVAFSCVLVALLMVLRIHKYYDTSLLSWRLNRRKRRSSIPNLDF